MPVPDLILEKGEYLISQTSSPLSIQLDNSPFLNGTIDDANDLAEKYLIGDIVLFDPSGATIIKHSGTDYYLTLEEKIRYKEVVPL